MDSRLYPDSTSLAVGNPLVAVQPAKGAEINRTDVPFEGKDGEYPVCFELMGMGDLEVVDVADVTPRAPLPAKTSVPYSAWGASSPPPPEGPAQDTPFTSFCSTDWAPSDASSDTDGEDFLKGKMQDCLEAHCEDAEEEDVYADSRAAPAAVRSKLSVAKVVQVSILPEQASASTSASTPEQQVRARVHLHDAETRRLVEVVDVEGDVPSDDEDDDEDEACGGAPTPDNTPQHSPSEDHQPEGLLLALESGSALYSTLKGMAMSESRSERGEQDYCSSTPSPACSLETSPGGTPAGTLPAAAASTASATPPAASSGGTLGRVWSLILGRGSRTQAQGSPAPPQPPPPRPSDSDDEDSADDDALYVDPQTIEELEATLEEVRLDGDGDDPVVSYLVEEAEDAARAPGAASREVTVEEVHEDDDDDGVVHGEEGVDDVIGEGGESRAPPAPKASGLLARIFSRTRTSQDMTQGEPQQNARRAERGAAVKRACKGDVSNSDRLLHVHRMKPRQPNKAAVRGSLSKMLGRWLRQGGQGGQGGACPAWGVGAEGDTGDSGLSVRAAASVLSPRRSVPQQPQQPQQPPALQSVRRATAHALDTAPSKFLEEGCSVEETLLAMEDNSSVGEKLIAEFGSQTEESHLSQSASKQNQEESRSGGKVLKANESKLTDVLGLI